MIKAIVTDIEGTTSSLSFVKEVLFPYARSNLRKFVAAHKDEEPVRALLQEAKTEVGGGLSDDEIVEQMLRWIDEDKKITALKSLQGLIWEDGYRNGDYTGHMYDDAVENLRRWHEQGIPLYVYSSGSVHAQKLLFGHTDHGDLTGLFDGYFDTHIGHKRDTDAYQHIVEELKLPAEEILFLSDTKEELDAAQAAGMQTIWLVREGKISTLPEHPQVDSFDSISI
jgi:enolase-phosphatase E1